MSEKLEHWKNRIIGHDVKKASAFKFHPDNWRTHPTEQQEALLASLEQIGWIGEVRENVTTGHLIDGHLRVKRALEAEDQEVPFTLVELTVEEEAFALATLDPISAMASADAESFARVLEAVNTESTAIRDMLVAEATNAGLFFDSLTNKSNAPDDFPEYDEEIDTDHRCPKCGYEWSGASR